MKLNSMYSALPIPLQNLACSVAGWQRAHSRYTPHFHARLQEWMQSVDEPIESLYAMQQSRLIELIGRARQFVPHYAAMDIPEPKPDSDPKAGIERILAAIPILEKSEYRTAPNSFIASDISRDHLFEGKTSGTTGGALPIWYSAEALAEEYASVWRLRCRQQVGLHDPHFSFGGQLIVPLPQQKPPFWRQNYWGRQTLFSLYHLRRENLSAYIDALHSLPAVYIQGYPSSFNLLGNAMLEAGRPLPPGKLKAIFTSSESLLAFQREVIEQAFSAPIFDRYGSSEFAVSMTGCSEGRLHVDMEFGIVEVEVQEETEDFVRGPLLVTGLGNGATPFIRYRIGDTGTRSKHPCGCGREGEVFIGVDGRVDDYVVTPDGRWVGRLDHVFKDQLEIAEAQIVQQDTKSIEVFLVPREGFDGRSEKSLIHEIRSRLGEEICIELRHVPEIAREANGKFRAVKSSVGRNVG